MQSQTNINAASVFLKPCPASKRGVSKFVESSRDSVEWIDQLSSVNVAFFSLLFSSLKKIIYILVSAFFFLFSFSVSAIDIPDKRQET